MFTMAANGKELIGRRVEYAEGTGTIVAGVVRSVHNHLGRIRLGVKWADGLFTFVNADHPLLTIKEA